MINKKITTTFNLTKREMDVLQNLAKKKELSKTAIIKQALRLFQLIDERQVAGDKLIFEDEKGEKKAEVFML